MTVDHTARAHARMSASKISRVAVCPGSLLAEEGLPSSTSDAAERGTAIHEIAEKILRQEPVTDVDDDMLSIASKYVTTAMEQTAHAKKHYIELDVTEALKSLHPSLGGTADLVAIGAGIMTVCDLKTGRIEVEPKNNLQLMTYALGAAIALKAPETVQIRLAIYQPDHGGWREWSCTYADLMAWKDKLRDLAIAAHKPDAPKNPDQEACRYCKAKISCDALRTKAVSAAKTEFGLGITPDQLEDAALCAAWADAVQDAAKKQLVDQPESIKGWTMKPGARMTKFKDEKMVAELLKDKPEAFSLKSASTIIKLGLELPDGMIEETRKAASLVKVKA
jgi:CRISPR/Cas system-associated exonuclease Cas4 (RecB family)